MLTLPAMAYTIDGCLDDWGVNLSEDWSLEETWVPLSPTTEWVVEDNLDCSQYYSGANYCGVHITGSGTSYTYYAEPEIKMRKIGWWVSSNKQPYHERGWSARSRELNDIEAMYFDANETQAFVAIVTSIPLDKVMSDLAISFGDNLTTGDPGYECGIVLGGENKGTVYHNPEWSDTDRFKDSGPYRITGGTVIGTANVEYQDQRIFDFDCTNWVIELSVPQSVFEDFDSLTELHVTLYCGNDIVEIIPELQTPPAEPTTPPTSPPLTTPPLTTPPEEEIPEFSTIAIPMSITLVLLYYYRRKRLR
jgi:hypothetical protein